MTRREFMAAMAAAPFVSPKPASAATVFPVRFRKPQRFSEAAAELERAAALDARDPVTHYHLAQVYDRLGHAERETHAKLVAAQETVR
jgi:hypothetical protein